MVMAIQKRAWLIRTVIILVTLCAMLIGILIGSRRAAEYVEDRALMTRLNRSELAALGQLDGPVYVAGHKDPDADAVCSSLGYANLLRELGYEAQPVVLDEVDKESAYILKAAGIECPPLLEDASCRHIVLVDHSDYTRSVSGLESADIVGIIDDDGPGDVISDSEMVYDARPFGATATVVWIRYLNYGVEIDGQTATVLAGAILSDTDNLSSKTTTEADREALRALCPAAGIRDVEAFYQEMVSSAGSV